VIQKKTWFWSSGDLSQSSDEDKATITANEDTIAAVDDEATISIGEDTTLTTAQDTTITAVQDTTTTAA